MEQKEIRKLYNVLTDDIDKRIMKSSKYKKQREIASNRENKLRDFIGKDGFKLQEEFMDEYIWLNKITEEEIFVYAFSLSNKLRDESLSK